MAAALSGGRPRARPGSARGPNAGVCVALWLYSRPMALPLTFSALFLGRRPSPPAEDPAALDARLRALVVEAERAWPGIALPGAAYLEIVADRAEPGTEPLAALDRLHATDLYLATGCARGDAAALQHFDRALISLLPAVLASLLRTGLRLDETQQLLRQRLLVAENGPPRIATYSGRGPLEGWFRAAALRLALNLRRGEKARPQEVPLITRDAPAVMGAETELARARYRGDFQAALGLALSRLSSHQRLLLRWHFFESLPLSQIAALEGVAKSTVSRWLSAAREEVLALTREELQKRVPLDQNEVSSLVRVLFDGAEPTLSDLLSRVK